MRYDAKISDDGKYRYALIRVWDPSVVRANFIMLNPSTADAERDDPTIRRCMGFAKRWGFGGVNVLNLYAYRATNPKELLIVEDPVGPSNDLWIKLCFQKSQGPIVAAWGNNARLDRVQQYKRLALSAGRNTLCLGKTTSGMPKHPLYLSNESELELWY